MKDNTPSKTIYISEKNARIYYDELLKNFNYDTRYLYIKIPCLKSIMENEILKEVTGINDFKIHYEHEPTGQWKWLRNKIEKGFGKGEVKSGSVPPELLTGIELLFKERNAAEHKKEMNYATYIGLFDKVAKTINLFSGVDVPQKIQDICDGKVTQLIRETVKAVNIEDEIILKNALKNHTMNIDIQAKGFKELKEYDKPTAIEEKRLKFWEGLIIYAKEKNVMGFTQKPQKSDFYRISIGKTGVWISLNAPFQKNIIRCCLRMDKNDKKKLFKILKEKKDEIEKKLGYELDWGGIIDKDVLRIYKEKDFTFEVTKHDIAYEWLTEKVNEFSKVFKCYV